MPVVHDGATDVAQDKPKNCEENCFKCGIHAGKINREEIGVKRKSPLNPLNGHYRLVASSLLSDQSRLRLAGDLALPPPGTIHAQNIAMSKDLHSSSV